MFMSSGVATQMLPRGQIAVRESLRKAKLLGVHHGPRRCEVDVQFLHASWMLGAEVGPEDREKQCNPTTRNQGGADGVRHKSKGMGT